MKEKMSAIYDYIVKHCKIVFPIVLIVVIAVTVVIALGAKHRAEKDSSNSAENSLTGEDEGEGNLSGVVENVPLTPNEEGDLYTLVATYLNAMALGDTDTLVNIFDHLPENNIFKIEEMAKYIDYYSTIEIYTKDGLNDDSTVVYVFYKIVFVNHEGAELPGYETLYACRNEQGELYIKAEDNLTEEEKVYIKTVTMQDDVVEFNNRVTKEYNDLIAENPELLRYLDELGAEVDVAVGVRVAQSQTANTDVPDDPEQSDVQNNGNQNAPEQTEPEETGPQYATATTTVNVRSSDSEQADKLGKVSGGTTVEVQEVRVNGWTKIVYQGKDGFIKSEYLQMQESAAGTETIGTVTATTNINVRTSPSETADRLGVLAGGETVDLIVIENGWCKIKYDGRIAYVKADYVQQN